MVTATLRMYAVGFGDCFLLTVPRFEERPWRMLVDCGVHGMGRGEHSLGTVISDLIATCSDGDGGAPVIDLVVASHRHQDHIAGFTDARWGDVTVGEVWLPWCEDPTDTEAQRLRTRLDGAARTLHQQFAVDGPEIAAIALNSLSNERAMTTLRDGFAGQPTRRFLSAARTRTDRAGRAAGRAHPPARSGAVGGGDQGDGPAGAGALAGAESGRRSGAGPGGRSRRARSRPPVRSDRRTASPTGPSSGSATRTWTPTTTCSTTPCWTPTTRWPRRPGWIAA